MKRKHQPRSDAWVSVQFMASDWLHMDRDEFSSGHPRFDDGVAYINAPWPRDWFNPEAELLTFTYVGSFQSRMSNLWFACDGHDVGAVQAWGAYSEMKAGPPRTAAGEIDVDRLAAFEKYVAVRERADVIIQGARRRT